jgi:hypothetical protein
MDVTLNPAEDSIQVISGRKHRTVLIQHDLAQLKYPTL